MKRTGLDIYFQKSEGLTSYLQHHGWHFSRKASEFAASMMRRRDASGKKERIKPYTREEVDAILQRYGLELENNLGYDAVYVANMCKADMLKSSVPDELHLALHIKDVLDDVDAPEDTVFFLWYWKMVHAGVPVDWEEMI